jgi:hypothetical protein
MAKLGDEIDKHVEESMPFLENMADLSTLVKDGYFTVAQCAALMPAHLPSGKPEILEHYYVLACLDIAHGELVARHPESRLPYSQYLRMMEAGVYGEDGDEMPVPTADWLVLLEDAEKWLHAKGININFEKLKADLEAEQVARIATVSVATHHEGKINNWEDQARLIADECFDADTKNGSRDSLKGYSERVMDKMQERGIRGPRGIVANPKTVMREALQGGKWWKNKQK